MIPRRAALIALLAAAALAMAAPAAGLTVATYNVENYNLADRMVENVFRQAYPKPEDAKVALRRVIRDVNPDLVAIQEMGSQPFLDELRQDLAREGCSLPHGVVLEAADPDRHVAVLSRVPFKHVRRHAAVPVTLFGQRDVVKRGVLEVTVATPAGDVGVFIVHLKSRRTERPDDPEGATQREREAEAVRDLVLERHPDPRKAMFVVCGDFNDTRGSRAVRSLLARGEVGLGELVRAADSRGETWTHHYRREDTYSRIDYFLVSPGLSRFVEGGRGHVHDGPGTSGASDHRMVYLRLALDAAGAPR